MVIHKLTAVSIAGLLGSACAQLSLTPLPAAAPDPATRITAPAGPLVGSMANGLSVWEGIPYAQPPVGALRWRSPQALPAWTQERPALQPGAACPQYLSLPGQTQGIVRGAEDCLFLNIYAPANAKNLPVMVWIHGGSFTTGAGSDYNPRTLAREQNVVVVTLNYRLGALGFMALPGLEENGSVGNYGLLDQQLALKWVRQNIAAFGGDAANVTAFGESAGGMSLCQHLLMPGARGLFDKAIIQSGPCLDAQLTAPRNVAVEKSISAAEALGCTPADAACLRAIPLEKVVQAQPKGLPANVAFPPLYGDPTLPASPNAVFRQGGSPAAVAPVPLLIGSNQDEGTIFAAFASQPGRDLNLAEYLGANYVFGGISAVFKGLKYYPPHNYPTRALAAATQATDSLFACPTSDLARGRSAQVPVYAYEFRDPSVPYNQYLQPSVAVPSFGAYHSAEVAGIMGASAALGDYSRFSAAQLALSRTMRTYWANFARTGNPNGAGLTEWPRLNAAGSNVMAFHPEKVGVVGDFRTSHQCEVWQ
ncbi:carboxylesterase/lipase family protein [Deinococcus sp.]|uniref:carboxylesterase/lipase family protein n=1 Tax=Deinococcus sp. TaxID=47478 RepID=UPI0025C3AF94|nr:carboxylesterase/lipase family protein [Deinococcus sp.]